MTFSAPPASSIPADGLVALAPVDVQKLAARMAQDAFSQAFRLTLNEDDAGRASGVAELSVALRNWSAAGKGDEARALRLALIVAGLDSGGSRTARLSGSSRFGAVGTGRSSAVGLDPQQEAKFQPQFAAIERPKATRSTSRSICGRAIHLALWHAMIASEEREQATAIWCGWAA